VVGLVTELGAGVYKYLPHDHVLEKVAEGNRMKELSEAAAAQLWLGEASIVLVLGRFTRELPSSMATGG